jgi:hypothetical protein
MICATVCGTCCIGSDLTATGLSIRRIGIWGKKILFVSHQPHGVDIHNDLRAWNFARRSLRQHRSQ